MIGPKYTHTHTHTHIYIYIYIYVEVIDCGESDKIKISGRMVKSNTYKSKFGLNVQKQKKMFSLMKFLE